MLLRFYLLIICKICVLHVAGQSSEKIHLHLDKDIYLPGETIWFKGYLFYNNQPSFLSTNFYLSVYDSDGKLLQEKHYPVFGGTCNGEITLPDSLSASTLSLRVVTKGLLLADSNSYFERIITVFQKEKSKYAIPNPTEAIQLSFIPEGGTAIAGLQNVFAIKAVNSDGASEQINGIVVEDNTGSFIDSFFTNQYGMGRLKLIPEAGKSYSAIWLDKNNSKQTTVVINHTTIGVLFHFEKVRNVIYCNVLKNSSDLQYNSLTLKAYSGTVEVLDMTALMHDKVQWINKIPLESLPEGIIHFKLFTAENKLLQERIILNRTLSSQKNLNVKILRKEFTPKAENIMELEISDSLLYNLSISVADINFYEPSNRNNIEEDLWLTTDILSENQLTKIVFQNNAESDIDELLLTAKQSTVKKEFATPQLPLDNFLSVGAVFKNKNYALPKASNLMLIINDTILGKRFYKVTAESPVNFIKGGVIFYDSALVNYQLDKNKEDAEYLNLLTYDKYKAAPFIAKHQLISRDSTRSNVALNSENILIGFVDRRPKKFNEIQTIKEVVVKSRYKNPETIRTLELDQKYTSGMFSGIARGFQLNVLDDKNAWAQTDVINYLIYRVPGLMIIKKGGERIIGSSRGELIIFVNEVELPEQTGISSISMTQVAYIKYIPGIVIGSSFTTSGGVLYIYTKKGDEAESDYGLGMRKIKLKGYDISQEFSSPNYTDKKNLLNVDMRTTLYWNPYLIMDKINNKFEIKFNNNDVSQKLLLTIEGFTEEGKLIHIEKVIEN
ncbi:MAG: hypothetical protein ABI685_06570 [Ferruginibacter sp.]